MNVRTRSTRNERTGLLQSVRLRWVAGAAGTLLLLLGMRLADRPDGERWVEVERRDLVVEVDFSGELEAVRSTDYGPPGIPDVWEYKIAFMAEEGQRVAKGDPLVGFDTEQLTTRLQGRMADRDAAQKRLEKRRTALDVERRNAELALAEAEAKQRRAQLKVEVPPDVVANHLLKTAIIDRDLAAEEAAYRAEFLAYLERLSTAELEVLTEERDRQVAKVREIESRIEQMTVRALRGGTVLYVSRRGEKKKVGDQVWRADAVVSIPDLDEIQVQAEVDEAKAGRLEVGQVARFRLDTHPERIYTGRVSRIAKTVQERSWRDRRRVVRLELALDETDTERMRPGMRLHGAIEIEQLRATLALPLEAIVPSPEGPGVRLKKGLGETWLQPELGERTADWVQVESGLDEGDRVLVGPVS